MQQEADSGGIGPHHSTVLEELNPANDHLSEPEVGLTPAEPSDETAVPVNILIVVF